MSVVAVARAVGQAFSHRFSVGLVVAPAHEAVTAGGEGLNFGIGLTYEFQTMGSAAEVRRISALSLPWRDLANLAKTSVDTGTHADPVLRTTSEIWRVVRGCQRRPGWHTSRRGPYPAVPALGLV